MKHFGIVIPPPSGLIQRGPLVSVALNPPLVPPGQATSLQVKLMVDTGAQCTVVEDAILQGLGLVPIGFSNMVGVSQVAQKCPVYLLSVGLMMAETPNGQGRSINCTITLRVIGMPSPSQPAEHVGLLGRDFLSHFQFGYDGPSGTFVIEMPPGGIANAGTNIGTLPSPPKNLPPKPTKNQRKAARQRQRGR